MNKLSLKQVAMMKKEFLSSTFGQYAAEKINELYGDLHGRAEDAVTAEQKATYVDRAAGIKTVIQFFTADIELLDQGYFDEKKGTKPKE